MLSVVENSVWHAFDFISIETNRTSAKKGKLKVLTSSIGHIVDVSGAEKGLDDFRSTPTLTFDQFKFYLEHEVFNALPDKVSVDEQMALEKRIDEVCWLICCPLYLERSSPVLPANSVNKLWRLFCMLGEMVLEEGSDEDARLEVVMAAGEVETIFQEFLTSIGRADEWDPEEFDSMVSVLPAFKFSIFMAVLESKYAQGLDRESLVEAISDIHDQYINDVLKKGKLKKHMEMLPVFREGWWVIQPRVMTVYSGCDEKDKRGAIVLDQQCRVESIRTEGTRRSLMPIKQKPYRFILYTNNQKQYEFQTSSHRCRLQWISAIKKAIDNSGPTTRYQMTQAEHRRQQREEELKRRLSDMNIVDQTRAELEAEKAMRVEAEASAAHLSEQRDIESKRLKELEDIRMELEALLEEEKQAKRDEEIVRGLQARMLTEEWERREVLEKLQEEQKEMLNQERSKREEWEHVGNERADQMREAERKIIELEEERKKLDEELKKHREKARRSNIGQEVLETKIKVKEQEAECEKEIAKEAASRVPSLNPTQSFYMRNRNRGSNPEGSTNGYRPMRSASMRETSYSRSIRRRNRAADSVSIRSNCNGTENLEVNNNNNLRVQENV